MNFSGANKTKGPGGPVIEVFIKIIFEPFNERMTKNEDLGNATSHISQYCKVRKKGEESKQKRRQL